MTPSEIAKGLSKAQREALLGGTFKLGSMALSLNQLGLVERNHVGPDGGPYVGVIEFTPLGLAVRAIIEQESRGE